MKILIALVLGATAGFIFKERVSIIEPVGQVFLRLLKMTIIPLVFFSVTTGIAQVSDLSRLKRVGVTFLKYWLLASLGAAAIGLLVPYFLKPGTGITLPASEVTNVDINLVDTFV